MEVDARGGSFLQPSSSLAHLSRKIASVFRNLANSAYGKACRGQLSTREAGKLQNGLHDWRSHFLNRSTKSLFI